MGHYFLPAEYHLLRKKTVRFYEKKFTQFMFRFMRLACLRFLSHAEAINELGTSRRGCYKLKNCVAN